MPPNQPVIRGRGALKTFYDDLVKDGATNLKIDVAEVSGHGPPAYQSGTFAMDLKPSAGPTEHEPGKYLFIARKPNGPCAPEYKGCNRDLPPAPGPRPPRSLN